MILFLIVSICIFINDYVQYLTTKNIKNYFLFQQKTLVSTKVFLEFVPFVENPTLENEHVEK